MKIISNDKLIKRNGKIGNILSLGSLVILGVGMFLSFKDKDGSLLAYTFGALILGFLLFQIGNYYMSKWGKSPRPDERLTAALKGLDDKYSLYHYTTGVSHLLTGPAGVYCLLPFHQVGSIKYDEIKNKWKQTGGNFFLKTFGGENIGKPENEARYSITDAVKYLSSKSLDIEKISPEAILVFTNEKTTLDAENSPYPAVQASKLKEFLRKRAKERSFPVEILKQIDDKLS